MPMTVNHQASYFSLQLHHIDLNIVIHQIQVSIISQEMFSMNCQSSVFQATVRKFDHYHYFDKKNYGESFHMIPHSHPDIMACKMHVEKAYDCPMFFIF